MSLYLDVLFCVLDFLAVDFWLMKVRNILYPIVYVAADSTLLSFQLLIELKRNHSELPLSVCDLIGKTSASWGKPQALQFLGFFLWFCFWQNKWCPPSPLEPPSPRAQQILSVSTSPLSVVEFAWRIKKGIFKGIWKYFQAMDTVYFRKAS